MCCCIHHVTLQKYVFAFDLGELSGLILYIPVLDSVRGK